MKPFTRDQVADSDDELVPLALRVYGRHGYVPIYMDLVAEHPLPSLRIPHYTGNRLIAAERLSFHVIH